ncbi:MAG: Uma2 family endonuclease [Oscillatoria princeps RMCB-10]|jgi:Uma2 family endonuclease|nr:Uma2 family endonuclease [Oscillatoria princeps RMCB-10]
MSELQTKLLADTWVAATWDEYMQAIEDPASEKAKCYYHNGQLRIEMSPVGANHSRDNGILAILVYIFCMTKGIPLNLLINCSYRQTGVREGQPDISGYIGERAQLAPQGNYAVDLYRNQPPDLAVEVADITLADDLGEKRIMYEDLGVAEYWVVDVKKARITAFRILAGGGSQRINESNVLPGLAMSLLEEGLQRSCQMDNISVGAWFWAQVQASRQ